MDTRQADIERLYSPTEHLKLFDPTPDNIMLLATHLMSDKWYLQDHLRKWPIIHGMIQLYLNGPMFSLLYNIGNMDGVGGFVNIIPGHRCDVILKLWNPAAFGPTLCREMCQACDLIMDYFRLYRLDTDSPDMRIVKLAKMLGFEQEGSRKNWFMWGGKPHTTFILGRKVRGKKRS